MDKDDGPVVRQPADFGLGLCDSERILTGKARAELERDLAALADQRQRDR